MIKKMVSKKAIISLVIMIGVVVINTFTRLSLPFIMSQFIDAFSNQLKVTHYILLYFALACSAFLISGIQKILVDKMSWTLVNDLRVNMMQKIIAQDHVFFQTHDQHTLIEYFEVDIKKILSFCTVVLPKLIASVISILFIITYLSYQSIYVLLFFIIYVFVDIILIKKVMKDKHHLVLEESKLHEQMNGTYGEWLNLRGLISHLGYTKQFSQRFDQMQHRMLDAKVKVNIFYYSIWCIALLLNTFADVFLLLIAGILFFNHLITIGSVYLFYSFGKKVQDPIQGVWQQLQFGLQCYHSLIRIQKLEPQPAEDRVEEKVALETINTIACNALEFGYHKGETILKKVNLVLKQGHVVGLFGNSGDGKSTLCKLMTQRMSAPNNMILINHQCINKIDTKCFNMHAMYLSSHSFIVDDTLFNNIAMFNPEVTHHDVEARVAQFELLKYLQLSTESPTGLNTIIKNEQLSSGQKQLIAIFRLLFVKKQFIIFDEAFSDISSSLTNKLLNMIISANPDAMIILVSHQLEKLALSNTLYRMRKGVLEIDESR